MTVGSPGIISIACAGDPSLARVGTRSVQQGVEADTWPSGAGARAWSGGGQAQLNSYCVRRLST